MVAELAGASELIRLETMRPGANRRAVLGATFAAILFDNDSTLTDSQGAVYRSWLRWAQHFDVPLDRLQNVHGMPSGETIARIAPKLPQAEARSVFDRLELNDLEGVTALPGALDALRDAGDRAAIVTSAGRKLLRHRLASAGIPAPTVTVTADDVARGKPAPDPDLEAARRLGVGPRDCLVVEDAVAGVRSGRAAGAATLAFLTTATADFLMEADLIVRDLSLVRFRQVDGGVRLVLVG